MTTISQTLLDTVNGSGTSTKSAAEETEDRFLTLLVEQMKNQDPLNPMENAEVTSQMAQLSTVTGIDTLNETMTSMISSIQAGQSYQAASMIGRSVLTTGDSVTYSGETTYFGYSAETAADNATVTIKDAAGNVIKTSTMSDIEAGVNIVQWDGTKDDGSTAPEGEYTFEVSASLGSTDIKTTNLSLAAVTSISTNSSGVTLNLSDNNSISTSEVVEIF